MRFSLRHLTIERTAFFILFILLIAMANRTPVDTDMWWHMKTGQHMLETREMIYTDVFSFTFDGAVRTNHSTFAQILLYIIWSAAGNFGLVVYTSTLAVGGLYLLYKAGSGSVYMQSFILIFGAASAAAFWSPRPQMFSFFLGTFFIYILMDYKRNGRDRLWWLIPAMWLWGNSHGGFMIGFIFLGTFIVGEFINTILGTGDTQIGIKGVRKLVLITIGALAILLLNPNGTAVYAVPFDTFNIKELRLYIQEWQSPNFNDRFTWGFVVLLAITIGSVWGSQRKFDWTDWLLVSGTMFMALMAGRNMSVFTTVAVPIATYHLDSMLRHNNWVLERKEEETPRRARINLALIILVIFGMLGNLMLVMDQSTIDEGQGMTLPVDAVEHLKTLDLEGNMFNSYNWGGYLIFNVPQHKVFIDGRTDIYLDFVTEYVRIATGSAIWREEFEKWDIEFAVIETGSGLAKELEVADGWRTEYQDDLASIFVREAGA